MTDKMVWFVTGAGRGMGIDIVKFLNRTEEMVHACGATVPATDPLGI